MGELRQLDDIAEYTITGKVYLALVKDGSSRWRPLGVDYMMGAVSVLGHGLHRPFPLNLARHCLPVVSCF